MRFPSLVSIRRFLADESGATSIEYAIIAGIITIAIAATLYAVGVKLQKPFNDAANGFN